MDISGEWYNELRSMMIIEDHGSEIIGRYQTAVGDADGWYQLVGRVSLPADDNRALGFVVTWQNETRQTDSCTVWCGEVRETDGTQSIETTWLLTIETTPGDDWKSTLVGKDRFTRIPPEASRTKNVLGVKSHHPKA